ncbi:unnamed protein product [Meganyctiphanes norvegica]|uniref:Uncharacterized protein n=1 Tax=Meganyctiphanes norvegica TaxID=48144 RepID=A0AAV2S4E6_MEGNR
MKCLLFSIMLFGLTSTGLCGDTINCYIGSGNVGDNDVKEEYKNDVANYTMCSVSSSKIDGKSQAAVRAGSGDTKVKCVEGDGKTCYMNGTCVSMWHKTCYCGTNLCNNAPATVLAVMPLIAMAALAKFII